MLSISDHLLLLNHTISVLATLLFRVGSVSPQEPEVQMEKEAECTGLRLAQLHPNFVLYGCGE